MVRKYQHRVSKLIGYYTNDPHEILDITQEAFLKAYSAIGGFRFESTFYTWLYRIAVNTAKSHKKEERRHKGEHVESFDPEANPSMEILVETSTPENHLLENERTKLAMAALENLSADLKMTFYLRELEGLTYEAIAQIMDCPVGTVRSRLSRARMAIARNKR